MHEQFEDVKAMCMAQGTEHVLHKLEMQWTLQLLTEGNLNLFPRFVYCICSAHCNHEKDERGRHGYEGLLGYGRRIRRMPAVREK
jgi:hypothetical protein